MKAHPFKILVILMTFAMTATAQYTEEAENIQYVSWGLVAGPNMSGCRMALDSTDGAPDQTHPCLGFDAGGFLEYHITPRWSLQFQALGALERTATSKDGLDNLIAPLGINISAAVCHRYEKAEGTWLVTMGPYTHFMMWNDIYGEGNLENPFTRIISSDPRTGEPRFAMTDFCAGLEIAIGYEFASHWQIRGFLMWGITDLLNVDSHDLYVKPYKAGCLVAYHFL